MQEGEVQAVNKKHKLIVKTQFILIYIIYINLTPILTNLILIQRRGVINFCVM